MKKISLFILLALAVWYFYPSGNQGYDDRKIELKNANDSISFAVAMLVSQDMPNVMFDHEIDSATLDDFVQGIRDAFPVDDTPEARAYARGVIVAASAMKMLDRANKAIYPDDTTKRVDRKLFLEGLVATAYNSGKTMTTGQAIDYYNHRVFRSVSEEFINKNKVRPGVVTLPSGLQYKIESQGSGKVAGWSSVVSCIYKLSYPNGALLDSSRGEAVELVVEEQLPGLAEALVSFPVGTKCKLYVPWQLGYGSDVPVGIAPYSALVYDLEIVGIATE